METDGHWEALVYTVRNTFTKVSCRENPVMGIRLMMLQELSPGKD